MDDPRNRNTGGAGLAICKQIVEAYQGTIHGEPWVLGGWAVVVKFTASEFQLLEKLSQAPGHIFNRAQWMDNMYHDHRVVSGRTIGSDIKRLGRVFFAITL